MNGIMMIVGSLLLLDGLILIHSFSVDLFGQEPTCVDIPSELSLCQNIGYNQMRLPNLLNQDKLSKVKREAENWVPLLLQRCHKDIKLFLCSLFAPVCVCRPIFPCKSLCEAVKAGCLKTMKENCFEIPWPEIFRCDQFPSDNELCIRNIEKNTTEKAWFTFHPGKKVYFRYLLGLLKHLDVPFLKTALTWS